MTSGTTENEPPAAAGNAIDRAPEVYDRHAEAVSKATTAALGSARQFVRQNNVLAVPALVLSCLGLVTYVCAPVGAILGHIARGQVRRRGQSGGGFALAAIILGWTVTALYSCGLGLTVVMIVLKIGAIGAWFS